MIAHLTLIVALAANIDVTEDIATSTTWTADNTYNLTKQIYVLPGATLTIEAGTVIASPHMVVLSMTGMKRLSTLLAVS